MIPSQDKVEDFAKNHDTSQFAAQKTSSGSLSGEWLKALSCEVEQEYMKNLKEFLLGEAKRNRVIYPQMRELFTAFHQAPLDKVRVVILGQDPYHGAGQAHGLSFSVPPGVKMPPTLVNIFKELQYDLGIEPPKHGHLSKWAEQGVLLLNSVLTVEEGKPGSHRGKGWEQFTDKVIEVLSERKEHLVFMLWGAYAQRKGARINRQKHLVLETAHPSPLSVYRGFFRSRPFSQCNRYLISKDQQPVNWQL